MSPIPSPTDILSSTLTWLGVPFLVILPFVIALSISEWIRAGQVVTLAAQFVSRGIREYFRRLLGRAGVKLALLGLAQAFLVAALYSLFRLIYAMGIKDGSGYSIAQGRSFRFSELWINVVAYSGESELAVNAALVALGWALGVDVAIALRLRRVAGVLLAVRWPVTVASIIGAVAIGCAGLAVLSNATWLDVPGYNVEMVSLYACWVILLGIVTFATRYIAGRADELSRENIFS